MSSLENTKCNPQGSRVRKRWLFAAAAYYLFLTYLSSLPGQTLRDLPFSFWDKGVHFFAYAVLGGCLALAFSNRPGSARFAILVTAAITALLGGLDEVHQLFTPGRTATVSDALADLLGGTFGALVAVLLFAKMFAKKRDKRRGESTPRPSETT